MTAEAFVEQVAKIVGGGEPVELSPWAKVKLEELLESVVWQERRDERERTRVAMEALVV